MIAVIQRVSQGSVSVEGKMVGDIKKGFLILLGVKDTDTEQEAVLLARKTASLRVFEDEEGKMNISLAQIKGDALVVSQFTLLADVKKGNRPSFSQSAEPGRARMLYELFCQQLRDNGVQKVETGVFGAHMEVSLVNDGPVTIYFNTDIWRKQE